MTVHIGEISAKLVDSSTSLTLLSIAVFVPAHQSRGKRTDASRLSHPNVAWMEYINQSASHAEDGIAPSANASRPSASSVKSGMYREKRMGEYGGEICLKSLNQLHVMPDPPTRNKAIMKCVACSHVVGNDSRQKVSLPNVIGLENYNTEYTFHATA